MSVFDRFVETHPPDGPFRAADLDRFRDHAPADLLAFWERFGWGWFGGGLLHLPDPATLADGLAEWLGGADPTRIPFGRSSFGDLFYWRDLRERARQLGMTGENPGELGDVSAIDVHHSDVFVAALSIEDLLDAWCDTDILGAGSLRQELSAAAREIYGPLGDDECWGFVPALALGGDEDLASVRKVHMGVHWSILRQTGG